MFSKWKWMGARVAAQGDAELRGWGGNPSPALIHSLCEKRYPMWCVYCFLSFFYLYSSSWHGKHSLTSHGTFKLIFPLQGAYTLQKSSTICFPGSSLCSLSFSSQLSAFIIRCSIAVLLVFNTCTLHFLIL